MNIVRMVFLGSALLTSGCSSAYDSAPLDPPQENNQWITIKGVIPPNVTATINPKYRSSVCKKPRAMSDGTVGATDNLAGFEVTIQPQADGSYENRVAIQGGSRCDWQLYDILLFTEPKNAALFKGGLPNKYKSTTFDTSAKYVTVSLNTSYHRNISSSKIDINPKYYPVFLLELPVKDNTNGMLFIEPAGIVKKKYTFNNTNKNPTLIHFSPNIDNNYTVYVIDSGSLRDKTAKRVKYYPNGDESQGEYGFRPYKYYEKN
ncbi:hypothetical protein M2366_003655 [Aeromonas sp. BIGb0405]|uniref:hypothetical protein n=1 Tax=unclassified Aeromonas TaxID=257493 RepID=UPI0021671869|nr:MULTISPECIES: hypothetical protein [unclassified Aeromonas]MCS3457539.1 hypothetical protein [Aeromonas sp. BIGb0405]MCS3461539.1 hypothetical protein [Aeromonas sp. BIGb0445]